MAAAAIMELEEFNEFALEVLQEGHCNVLFT